MTSSRVYPKYDFIVGITNAQQAEVEFFSPHDFTLGENISFRVSKPFGMIEIDDKVAKVLSIPSTTSIIVNIDTTFFTPFIYPPIGNRYSPAMVVPSSSGVIPDSVPSAVNLEDSFDRIRT